MAQLKETLRSSILGKLKRNFSKDISQVTKRELYDAAASSIMDSIQPNLFATRDAQEQPNVRQMYYFSAEFLMGRALSNNLNNTGMRAVLEELLTEFDSSYHDIEDEEPDAGLGNGGLGPVFWTRWQRSTIPDTATESAISTVCLSSGLKTGIKWNTPITGGAFATRGKYAATI